MSTNSTNISDKMNFWLSIFANLITIIVPIVTYFAAYDALLYVGAVLFAVTILRNIFISNKNMKIEAEVVSLQAKKAEHEDLIANNQITMEKLEHENLNCKKRLLRIHEDLIAGKVSSDILINYYIDEVDNQFVNFEKMEIDAYIHYIQNSRLYDVTYSWNVLGQNPSTEIPLSKLCFIISGDSIVKNNDELRAKIEIKKSNGEWKQITGYISGGSDKIKYLNISLSDYAILPNRSFNIRFSYTWPRSYVADGGDVFSFGSNTFSSTNPYDMSIKIHADKKCFSSAKLQIRNRLDESNSKNQFSELDIIEANEEHIVSVSLPASEIDRAIYISLVQ